MSTTYADLAAFGAAIEPILVPIGLFAGVALTAWLAFRGKRGETDVAAQAARASEQTAAQAALSDRFDDAGQIMTWLREEVERQVAPIRAELADVKKYSHELADAMRSYQLELWVWDQRGRPGGMPLFAPLYLHKLGLGHLVIDNDLDDTIRIDKEANTP